MNRSNSLGKRAILVALFAAFTSAGCFIQIPLAGGIPIVIQDMMAMLSGLILGPIYGTLSVFIFLVLGSIGLPVFSGKGGFDKILNGPTGGFLIGYMIAALAGGLIVRFFVKNPYKTIAQDSETPETNGTTTEFSAKTNILNWIFFTFAAITATVICFAFGIAGFHRIKPDLEIRQVLNYVLIPFIPGNVIKIFIMTPLAKKIHPIVKNYLA